MIRLFLILSFVLFIRTATAQNYFYLSTGNSTIIPCNSTTTSVTYNINSSATGLYTITIQPPVGGTSTLATSANNLGHTFIAAAGVYTFTGYDGAANTLGVIHFSVTLATVFNPTITTPATTICVGETTFLSFNPITSSYTINPFIWSTTQNFAPIAVSPTTTTTYSLSGLFTAGSRTCNVSDSKVITVNSCVGINELTGTVSFKIYPNPVNDILNIETTGSFDSKHYTITDHIGKAVKEGKLESEIDLSSLKTGVYFFTIENKTIKIIKQ